MGLFNTRNEHLWCYTNPHEPRPHNYQHRFTVNVWAGIVNNSLVGPVFLDRLNSVTYENFLSETLPVLLEDVPLASLRNMYYQHDGAPAHYSRRARELLDREYPGRWIGRGSTVIAWPARSPDLTPLDFYLWGHVKAMVYKGGAAASREALIEKICWAFNQIKRSSQVLSRVNEQLIFRCGLCVGTGGDYFERFVRDSHRHPRDSDLRGDTV